MKLLLFFLLSSCFSSEGNEIYTAASKIGPQLKNSMLNNLAFSGAVDSTGNLGNLANENHACAHALSNSKSPPKVHACTILVCKIPQIPCTNW